MKQINVLPFENKRLYNITYKMTCIFFHADKY